MRIGLLPLGRPTFDVPFAQEKLAAALAALARTGHDLVGPRALLFDAAATEAALAALAGEKLDRVLVLQVTFTDAAMTLKIAERLSAPLAIWAFPEPRTGGRLRLNSFCGLNLASHALGRAGRDFGWLYAAPEAAADANLKALLANAAPQARRAEPFTEAKASAEAATRAAAALGRLKGARIGLVGRHPDGFETCRYEPATLAKLAGVDVRPIDLPAFFDRARAVPAEAEAVAADRKTVAGLKGIDAVDQGQLGRSLTLFQALKDFRKSENLSAFAVRCWPEMFTDYGCAACGPMAMVSGEGTPCACEADVMGALTSLLMQEIAGAPAFLVDIVDIDATSDTGVVWHCGLAPLQMCDPDFSPEAAIHSNRRMPLLHHFPLKPGRVTLARITQARNDVKLVLGGAGVERAAPSFSGTSGVLRFDGGARAAMERLIGERLEHHVSIVYGDHIEALRAAAAAMGIEAMRLG